MSLEDLAKAREVWGLRRTGLGSSTATNDNSAYTWGTDLGLPGSVVEYPKGGWLSRGSQSPQWEVRAASRINTLKVGATLTGSRCGFYHFLDIPRKLTFHTVLSCETLPAPSRCHGTVLSAEGKVSTTQKLPMLCIKHDPEPGVL